MAVETKNLVEFGTLVRNNVQDYSMVYPDNRFQIEMDGEFWIKGNDARLSQMLEKLVANAVDHANNDRPIIVRLRKEDSNLVLEVIDEGERLPDDKKAMFDWKVSFRRSDHSEDDNFGVGLDIVSLIAVGHNGHVETIDLDTADGAVFRVTLPVDL